MCHLSEYVPLQIFRCKRLETEMKLTPLIAYIEEKKRRRKEGTGKTRKRKTVRMFESFNLTVRKQFYLTSHIYYVLYCRMILQARTEFEEKLNLLEFQYENHVVNPEGLEVRGIE